VSANDTGNGTGIWGITRLAAPALVALVLAGVALPWILDSGGAHLPPVGVGVSTGSASGPPAVAKVEVKSPHKSAATQQSSQSTTASAGPAQTSKPATGSSSTAGGQAATSPVVHPAHQSTTGPTRNAAPPSPVIKTTPRSHKPTPTTQPKASLKGQHEDNGDQSPSTTSHHGRALGHEKHAFRVKAAEDKGQPPRGLALGHRNHVPPGQAREENRPKHGLALGHHNHVPPGQARKHSQSPSGGSDDQSRDSQGDDNDAQDQSSHGHESNEHGHSSHGHHGDASPGHDDGSNGADSHGRGHGH